MRSLGNMLDLKLIELQLFTCRIINIIYTIYWIVEAVGTICVCILLTSLFFMSAMVDT